MIGEVLVVDGGSTGKFMRVRVRMDIDQPLKRCLRVDIMGDGVETVMLLRYERLPNHCFKCGRVGHRTMDCASNEPIPVINGTEEPLFGLWLRATRPFRKNNQR
ncbi:hypothetical protein Ddye_002919 [Dipteronia dyeriana]|uniref:CCHC-type domain-containing protein n=1 Tax=Dipteronia dyeriana TaxID=168575 RepID=A0AAE0CUT2_9ROSI|nr:hypothetical protein Ddye_002919 [Dipteronia dyeriana]